MFERSILKEIAKKEGVSFSYLESNFRKGRVVIPYSNKRKIKNPIAIGKGLKVKVNTNLGTSTERKEFKDELEKLVVAVKYGTDTVMDLSVGGNLRKIRKEIIKASPVPVGSVPIYEVASEVERRRGGLEKMTRDDIFSVLEEQAKDGIDFFTIHAGILRSFLDILQREKRTSGIVSRGGAILARWMYVNKRENPFYEEFDTVLDIAKKYRITISLGDALRPGAIADSTDKLQMYELFTLAELVKRCRRKNVQVMVEGPGHIRIDEIKFNMWIEKKLCDQAPFYVLGPLTTDIACGYDHIVSAIGGALAALWGADFLCVVTPAEHLRHPSVEDVKLGVIASKIAAHSVDLIRFKDEWERDKVLSLARAKRKWREVFKYALDREKAENYREQKKISLDDICTMCGKFCSLRLIDKCNLLK
ncbi:MAG TPA: phosphomethylpyrimidine synthase ThiC [Candidatus Omnitrophica bacterium]|nr:phosphomethylpyrimidine synthase ThiC [Candidatus Omnitrophota bacterium]